MKRVWCSLILALCLGGTLSAASYTNPVLAYDYSDPDVCQVGEDYYLTSSSFNCVPGLQILHSRDLVHWQIVDAALPYSVPGTENEVTPQYGGGVWAPSIRYHEGRFTSTMVIPTVVSIVCARRKQLSCLAAGNRRCW